MKLQETNARVWLCQYVRDGDRDLEARLTQGRIEIWNTSPLKKAALEKMNDGDQVVLWRTVDKRSPADTPKSRGGIIAQGAILLDRCDFPAGRLAFEVRNTFVENPIGRDDVLAHLGLAAGDSWPGQVSTRLLSDHETRVVLDLLPSGGELVDTGWHPLASGIPPNWASGWGQDKYGVFTEITHGSVTQRLRWCPPGRFTMGSPEDEPGRIDYEGPETVVTLSAGFWLFSTPVTQALYEAVAGENPSKFVSADRPVENVSWDDASKFIVELNRAHTGLDLRLPSEAEWEYACRAGTRTATWAGPIEILGKNNAPVLDEIAWYGGNSGVGWDLPEAEGHDASSWEDKQHTFEKTGTRRVGQKRANPWGLYDMLGNVLEWCADPWHENHEGADPKGLARPVSEQTSETPNRVMRGGAWNLTARYCRAAFRYFNAPDDRLNVLGFRPARGHEPRHVLSPEGTGPVAGKAEEAEPSAAQR